MLRSDSNRSVSLLSVAVTTGVGDSSTVAVGVDVSIVAVGVGVSVGGNVDVAVGVAGTAVFVGGRAVSVGTGVGISRMRVTSGEDAIVGGRVTTGVVEGEEGIASVNTRACVVSLQEIVKNNNSKIQQVRPT